MFQSTRPRGARHASAAHRCLSTCFNPRAREGRDGGLALREMGKRVSIHAPARGATKGSTGQYTYRDVSIHAPARGATFFAESEFCHVNCFNPRAREGRDTRSVSIVLPQTMFQSTRPRGARLPRCHGAGAHGLFQSTRPRGARPFVPPLSHSVIRFQSTRPRGARRRAKGLKNG